MSVHTTPRKDADASWGIELRAYLDSLAEQSRAKRRSPAHRASVEEYSRANDEAYERHLDAEDAYSLERDLAFKGERFAS